MNLFSENKDFYPTPKWLVEEMIKDVDFRFVQSVLEPSAGSGNIATVLKERMQRLYREEKMDIDCIEKDENLRAILKSKDFRVVHDDFLTFETRKEYNLIVMNPPFSNNEGAKHLLKALKLQERNGGSVICILNAETLKNLYTSERKVLMQRLEEINASIEYRDGYFENAERSTMVEIAIVKATLPAPERQSILLDELKKAKHIAESYEKNEGTAVADSDIFKALVTQYNLEVEAGCKLIREYKAMKPVILASFSKESREQEGSILTMKLSKNRHSYSGGDEVTINEFVREVRNKYWKVLFENKKFIGNLTSNLASDFYSKIGELRDYEFSLYNILQLKIDMNKRMAQGIETTIVELFDEFSHKYAWHEECSRNIHYYNGWSSNSAFKINEKVIIPLSAYSNYSGRFEANKYEVTQKIANIEKALAYLDGRPCTGEESYQVLTNATNAEETKNLHFRYFDVNFYKKGTCHITFTNQELLKKFNIYGSQKKGWLPPSYGKKAYTDMEAAERAVIDGFEGESSYAETVQNSKYYLVSDNQLLLEAAV